MGVFAHSRRIRIGKLGGLEVRGWRGGVLVVGFVSDVGSEDENVIFTKWLQNLVVL